MQLTLITPVSRLANIERIFKTIFKDIPEGLFVKWLLIIDQDDTEERKEFTRSFVPDYILNSPDVWVRNYPSLDRGISGNPQRNYGLSLVTRGFVYFLDDDTELHPDFYRIVRGAYGEGPEPLCLVGNQVWPNGAVRLLAGTDYTKKNHIDTAQFVLPRAMIGERTWDAFDYCADGAFIEGIYREFPECFVFVNEPFCYYNKLRALA